MDFTQISVQELWLIHELHKTCQTVEQHLRVYRVNTMTENIYHFVWGSYCDWGVEIAKNILQKNSLPQTQILSTMCYVLEGLLRLAHPLIPYVTEEIWQHLPEHEDWDKPASISVAAFPKGAGELPRMDQLEVWTTAQRMITALRTIRSRASIHPQKQFAITIICSDTQADSPHVSQHEPWIKDLANISSVTYQTKDAPRPTQSLVGVGQGFEVYAHVAAHINLEEEKTKLQKEQQRLRNLLQKTQAKITKAAAGAPLEVIQKQQALKDSVETQLQSMELNLQALDT